MPQPAPIVLFVYNRPHHAQRTLRALAANPLASESDLIIYADGAKESQHTAAVEAARDVARSTRGFASVTVFERESNMGLSRSIIVGVSEICARFGRAIVLEDDVVPTPFFLDYVNRALDTYADDDRVLSIGCHTFDSGLELPETFFLNIPDCWGWAVWQRSWKSFNADGAALLRQIAARNVARKFDFYGAYPYTRMLEEQVQGGNESWAVRWYAHAFLNEKLVLYPRRSVTSNIGLDGSGTHGGQPGGYKECRTADRPIAVSPIDVQESILGREAWRVALSEMTNTSKAGLTGKIRSRLRRMCRTLGPYLRNNLPCC